MSEFYNKKKKILLSHEWLKFEYQISNYSFNFLFICMLIYFIMDVIVPYAQYNIYNDQWASAIIVLVMIYLLMELRKKTAKRKRRDSLRIFMKDPDFTIENINLLIAEVENNIKRVNTFAKWIAGIAATLLVFILTTLCNIVKDFLATISFLFEEQIYNDNELIANLDNILENIFQALCKDGVVLFLFLSSIILGLYLLVSMWNIRKKQILLFFYDLRYILLSNDSEFLDPDKDKGSIIKETLIETWNHVKTWVGISQKKES